MPLKELSAGSAWGDPHRRGDTDPPLPLLSGTRLTTCPAMLTRTSTPARLSPGPKAPREVTAVCACACGHASRGAGSSGTPHRRTDTSALGAGPGAGQGDFSASDPTAFRLGAEHRCGPGETQPVHKALAEEGVFFWGDDRIPCVQTLSWHLERPPWVNVTSAAG